MNKKRVLALMLTVGMAVGTLAGCSSGSSTTAASSAAPAETTAEAKTEEAKTEEAAETEEAAAEEWDGEVTEINLLLLDVLGRSEGKQEVLDAMNAITESKIGVKVNIQFSGMSDYTNNLGLQLASGEPLDIVSIVPMSAGGFTTLLANGQLMDITDLLEEYGQDIMDLEGGYLYADSSQGKIYGVPVFRNYVAGTYLIMRKDLLEKVGMEEFAENMTTWTEVEELFTKVLDETGISPIGTGIYSDGTIFGADKFDDYVGFDNLGDGFYLLYTDNDGNVSNLMDNEDFITMTKRMQDFYQKNLVYKDLLTTDDHTDTISKSGVIFSSVQVSELGVETAKKEATGYDMLCRELAVAPLGSKPGQRLGFGVPVTSEEPEAAVRWMNELYTNPELQNLLNWGIEGRDYVVEEGVAKYPEGIDSGSVSYHQPDYMFGNYFNILPWDGNAADFRQVAYDYLVSTDLSPYMGFAADQSSLTNTIAALNSVYEEYNKQIRYGSIDDAGYEAAKAKYQAAGVDDYIAAYQEQLDAWKAAN